MTSHTRFSRFVTRVRERREERQAQRFEFQTKRLIREGELEERRAKIRKTQAVERPKGATSKGVIGFGQRFVQAQVQFMRAPSARGTPITRQSLGTMITGAGTEARSPVVRRKPRVAARGRTLFDAQGRPVSVRNAPAVRRARKRRKVAVPRVQQVQDPFAPTIGF